MLKKIMDSKESEQPRHAESAVTPKEVEAQQTAETAQKRRSTDDAGSSLDVKGVAVAKTPSSEHANKNSGGGEKENKEMSGEGMPKETRDKLGATTPATVLIDEDFRSLPDSVQPPEVVIQEEDYYHGFMPREDANSLLALDGDFLLRTTEIACGDNRNLCLSLRWKGVTHHVIVHKNNANLQYGLDPNLTFPTIADLIDFYTKKFFAIGSMRILLKNPILTQMWELKHSQIRLLKKLGEGAFGEVHYGRLALTPRFVVNVAVKLLKCGVMNKKKVDEMMTEVRMMRDMRHPNIVRFYGVANRQEPLMIVMELIKGGALDKYLVSKANEIKVETRVSMACDAALGLQYVHALGIMHRDIAARNCLYNGEEVKLSDFGMSKKGSQHVLDATEKAPIRWLAPEVFRTHIYTVCADVWAYGVLVWEIFNNAVEPYKGWNGAQVKMEVLKGYRLKMPDWAPPKIKQICERAWNDDMYTRPTLDEIANELLIGTGRKIPPGTPQSQQRTSECTTSTSAPSRSLRKPRMSRALQGSRERFSRIPRPTNVGGEPTIKSASTFLTRSAENEFDTESCDGDSRGSRECRSRERFRRRRIRRRQ
uniref:Tyrosine-protein kinase n=1 Tax=Ascaris suum TaxID=6253 RepID=F1KYN3_ASCSU